MTQQSGITGTASNTARNAPALTDYFWAITVQPAQTLPGATALITLNGTIGAGPNDTRQSLFTKIREYVSNDLRRNGQPEGHNVLFYTLEPNQL
ncbi:hypothetical protein ACFQ0X_43730 [Streptomyces rectiviolaceus]|uniref:Uncharacterized protein n=1 Tax=Streptomyces rectiviolaceus TaxID=332591 RepID=A0ABP6NS42_9ACTN